MAEGGVNGRQANLPAGPSGTGGDAGASPKLRGLDGNPQGAFGPRVWQAFRDTLSHRYTVSLPDPSEERSLADIARCCGFGGKSQFSRAFRAHFGAPPRQYLALIRQQDLDWHEARLAADGFDPNSFFWRQQGLSDAAASGPRHAPARAAKRASGAD